MPNTVKQYDIPSHCNQAFSGWSQIDHEPAQVAIIGILTGEGIGSELMAVCRNILEQIGNCTGQKFEFRTGGMIGTPAWQATGKWVTEEIENFCNEIHHEGGAVLCGPGGGRFVYELRRRLHLFCKLVPLRPTNALRNMGPLRPEALNDVDIMVVRENMGGLYQGFHSDDEDESVQRVRHCFDYTHPQVENILRVGAKLAQQRQGRLCVVYKPGGIPAVSDLWRSQAQALCYGTDIELNMLEVDNACYQMIANASSFDVVVAPNMFGDVLADGASVLLGSRGMSYSANFSENGIGIYQTGHGAAHDLAETDRANPIGQIYSMIFMLREHFDLGHLALAIENAVEDILAAGWRTADILEPGCREVGTQRLGQLIAEATCMRLTTA